MSSEKTVLVSRTEPGCSKLATALRERQFNPIVSPLMSISHAMITPLADSQLFQALIITSQHALQAALPQRHLPLYIVGEASASMAKQLGFTLAHTAETAEALYDYIRQNLSSEDNALLYYSGDTIRLNAVDSLPEFKIKRVVAYHSRPVPLSREALKLITAGAMDIVILQSVSAAKNFIQQIDENQLAEQYKQMTIICFSNAIAKPLPQAERTKYVICPQPNEASLLETLDRSFP